MNTEPMNTEPMNNAQKLVKALRNQSLRDRVSKDDDLITYLEIAHIALSTDEYLDLVGRREVPWLYIARQLDLSDEEMNRLRENLQTYLNKN
jgi:hypothetical protein